MQRPRRRRWPPPAHRPPRRRRRTTRVRGSSCILNFWVAFLCRLHAVHAATCTTRHGQQWRGPACARALAAGCIPKPTAGWPRALKNPRTPLTPTHAPTHPPHHHQHTHSLTFSLSFSCPHFSTRRRGQLGAERRRGGGNRDLAPGGRRPGGRSGGVHQEEAAPQEPGQRLGRGHAV